MQFFILFIKEKVKRLMLCRRAPRTCLVQHTRWIDWWISL